MIACVAGRIPFSFSFLGDLFALKVRFFDLDHGLQPVDAVIQALDMTVQFNDFGCSHAKLLTAKSGTADFVRIAFGFLLETDLASAGFMWRLMAEMNAVRADAVGDNTEFIMAIRDMGGGEANGLRRVWSRYSPGAKMVGSSKEHLMGFE